MIITNCKSCDQEFKTHEAWIKKGAGQTCSRECSYKVRKTKPKILIDKICETCFKDFKIRKGNGGNGRFCSVKCLSIWRGNTYKGSSHPCWKGGFNRTHKSKKIINELKKQIGICVLCGSKDNLQGNHIKPWKDFPEERENPLNIEIICIDCHADRNPKYKNFILSRKGIKNAKINTFSS